jgi:hypothetical protein
MRHSTIFTVILAVISMLTIGVAFAQQPTHQHDAAQQPPASAPKSAMPGDAHDAHHAQHMEMCRRMMGQSGMMGGGMRQGMMGGGMMGGGMMGMPMMMGGDPKQQAEMLAMRGEMMKAMGDIMMKYAQRALEGGKRE